MIYGCVSYSQAFITTCDTIYCLNYRSNKLLWEHTFERKEETPTDWWGYEASFDCFVDSIRECIWVTFLEPTLKEPELASQISSVSVHKIDIKTGQTLQSVQIDFQQPLKIGLTVPCLVTGRLVSNPHNITM